MTPPADRLREHPEERFRPAQHLCDLDQIAETLRREPLPAARNHRQQTLYKGPDTSNGPTTVALFVFEAGAKMPQHVAQGVVTIHTIGGRLRVLAEGQEHHLGVNQVLVLAPGVEHDVYAETDSRMLLTVCLETAGNH
jgi:quercetin dioxygenase-like cupin family protein